MDPQAQAPAKKQPAQEAEEEAEEAEVAKVQERLLEPEVAVVAAGVEEVAVVAAGVVGVAEEQTQRCTPCTCASNQCLLRWHMEQAAQA